MKISCPLKVLLRKLLVRNLETITFFAGDSHKKPFFIHKRLQFKVNKKRKMTVIFHYFLQSGQINKFLHLKLDKSCQNNIV